MSNQDPIVSKLLSAGRKLGDYLDKNSAGVNTIIEFIGFPAIFALLYIFYKKFQTTAGDMSFSSNWYLIGLVILVYLLIFFIRFLARHSGDKETHSRLTNIEAKLDKLDDISTKLDTLINEMRQERDERKASTNTNKPNSL